MLPLFGASNPRDTVGLAVDTVSTPHAWFFSFYVTLPGATVDIVNTRSLRAEDIAAERKAAFDFYSAVRSASIQFRENQVRDRAEPDDKDDADEDLYYLDEEDE